MKRAAIIAGLFCAAFWPALAVGQCLEYEPKTVNLSGILVRETHAGPPNYESINRGDKRETIWVLRLSKPICVTGTDDINVQEGNQREVQLVLEPEQFKKYRKLIGHRVVVAGKLFHAHTGHHHKTLLISVDEIKNRIGRAQSLFLRPYKQPTLNRQRKTRDLP